MVHSQANAVQSELDLAQSRRESGLPAISLLVAPPGVAVALWQSWCREHTRAVRCYESLGPDEPAILWLRQLFAACDLRGELVQALADRTQSTAADVAQSLAEKRGMERQLYLQRAISQFADSSLETLAEALLRCESSPRSFAHFQSACSELSTSDLLPAVLKLVPAAKLPAILVCLSGRSGETGPDEFMTRCEQAIRKLVMFAESASAVPLAVTVDAATFEHLEADLPPSRAAAMFRQSVVPLAGLSRESLAGMVGESTSRQPDLSASLDRLVADGVTREIGESFARAAAAVGRHAVGTQSGADEGSLDETQYGELHDDARSAAERFLFERLESLPETSGLFELNKVLPIPVGQRAGMEVDLACRPLKIAIEIDGYWHFQDNNAYRRDRRKDLALQRHGYLVHRCLAEDVVVRLEEILDTIQGLVALRRLTQKGDR